MCVGGGGEGGERGWWHITQFYSLTLLNHRLYIRQGSCLAQVVLSSHPGPLIG